MCDKENKSNDYDVELGSTGYEITLTHTKTGKRTKITLVPDMTKGHQHPRMIWRVKAKNFIGHYGTLDAAREEALKRLYSEIKEEGRDRANG